jgi:hypothetical protein
MLTVGLLVSAMPVADVAACSCAGGPVVEQVKAASIAFVGTVVDHRESETVTEIEGQLVEYAFRVERASAATPEITLVRVSGSEASCGVSFGQDEQWLVVLPPRSDMGDTSADTHLCAGNTPTHQLQPHEIGALDALLTVAPAPAPAASEPDGPPVIALAAITAGLLLLVLIIVGAIGLAAFRRSG